MDLVPGLKLLEVELGITADHIAGVSAKLEDLLFRTQKIANAVKQKKPHYDTMYAYDLQNFRRDLRTFGMEIMSFPIRLSALERQAGYDPAATKLAANVMRATSRFSNSLKTLEDMARLTQQHIHDPEHKIIAFYIAQEIEELALKGMSLPTIANKILIACTSVPG